MFWGVTLETGKRYSQVVDSSYHLSMAALEPLHSVESSGGKFVSVMIEHNKSEFLLCTLEHNKLLQVTLDHCFVEGEEVTYFLTGEGTVHLTGYIMTDGLEGADDSDQSEENEGISMTVSKKRTKQAIKQKNDSEDDDDDDEDDEDWKPDFKKQKNLPTLLNNVPGKFKTSLDNHKNATPKVKMEKTKAALEKPPEKASKFSDKQHQKKSPMGSTVHNSNQQSSDDDDDDDEDDEDFLMGDENDDDVEDEEDEEGESGEDSDEENGNSDWESADEDDEESPGRPLKKAKLEGDLVKVKQASGTTSLAKEKSPHLATPTSVSSTNQDKQSSKKKNKKKKKLSEGSPKVQTPTQKNSIDVSRSSSDSTPQSVNKPRKSVGGVEVQDLVQGNGPAAKIGKMVHVYYRGTFPDKREFDSCTKGKAFSFRLGRSEVIKGWDVGIQGMKVGGKRKLVVPPSMGYGSKASGPIPPNSTLHFEVELKAVS